MPVDLLEAAEVDSVDRDVDSGATSGARDFLLALEVTAGDTRLAGVVLPDVIRYCHLVRQDPPHAHPHTHTQPTPHQRNIFN